MRTFEQKDFDPCKSHTVECNQIFIRFYFQFQKLEIIFLNFVAAII